ncbi:MAG: P-loop NTPase [Thermovirgaceae bacterium]
MAENAADKQEKQQQEKTGGTCAGMPVKTKRNIKHVIAVGSGKGGVGKSTVSALLAVGLAKKGAKVSVLDADITGPSIPKLLGVREAPFNSDSGVVPPKTGWLGIRAMSINLMLDDPTKPVVWRGPLIGNVLRQFWEEVNWADTEFLIIDLPPGTADAALTVMQTIDLDGLLVVTAPQGLSALVVEKMMHMARMLEVPLLGLVENMGYAICPECGAQWELFGPSHLKETAEKWNIPVLSEIPVDKEISILGDGGRLEHYAKENIAENLAEALMASLPEEAKQRG